MTFKTEQKDRKHTQKSTRNWIYQLLLVYILIAGAALRLVGVDWDENQHLHPDERFLTMVEAAIKPVNTPAEQLGTPPTAGSQPWRENYIAVLEDCETWGGYFDTACSPLNPNNRGYDFYVYGTLPIFIVRYVAEWMEQTGYGEVYLVGRVLSAVSDLLVIVLVYSIASLLYDRRIALLGAAFSAFSVLLIQQSHFFTVDTFTNFFIMLAVYFGVKVAISGKKTSDSQNLSDVEGNNQTLNKSWSNAVLWPCIFFGLALGMAVASKINAVPLGVILPGAAVIYLMNLRPVERERQGVRVFVYLVIAAFVSLLAFRIFQPYAFVGPGFFGVKPNKAWIDDLSSLRAQTGGDVDFPPALQWARRPVWFSLQNMVLWGLGIPLGITAWVGFLWMGWRIIKGEWKKHSLLWGWTGIYFIWQSLQWNSTMRYQLPIYPLLAISAAWFIISLWDNVGVGATSKSGIKRFAVLLFGSLVLVLTLIWAFAFSRIYTRPHTRVEASRWLFQNMPGPVNLTIRAGDELYNQPLPYPQDKVIQTDLPQYVRFKALIEGELVEIYLPNAEDKLPSEDLSLFFSVNSLDEGIELTNEIIGVGATANELIGNIDYRLTSPTILNQGEMYSLVLDISGGYRDIAVCSPLKIGIQTIDTYIQQDFPILSGCLQRGDLPYKFEFVSDVNGILGDIHLLVQVEQPVQVITPKTLGVELVDPGGEVIITEELRADFTSSSSSGVGGVVIPLTVPVPLKKDEDYTLRFSLVSGNGAIAIKGTAPANESSWDDGLPLRMDGYDPYGGIYQGGLNFEMYWDDNQEKFERFVNNLNQADTILITSSRQWGTTTRVPERYPLTIEYYKRLLGCPTNKTIEWCYNVAQPGDFQGDLGFELIKVFQSNPSIGQFEINDQFSEEAFNVYDHPKVFVFKKSEDYDPDRVREILGAVDFSKVIRITPKQADSHPGNLLLPPGRLEEQTNGGTWSDYFNPEAVYNQYPILAVILWYVSVTLIGWVLYPILRFAMPGLADRGYPFARITGLLSLSAIVWLAGSARLPFNRTTIGLGISVLALSGLYLGLRQRNDLRQELVERWKYYVLVEGMFLVFFLVGILIRFGNPDLWHPWKGGEKPMDFSYFNAVLKSTSFPPYDPWFAGGYINYYYYGFVFVGVLVKYLGILPSIAYNLILPTLLCLIGMGAFSIVWNLISLKPTQFRMDKTLLIPAISGALSMAILGNLGILQMFTRGLQMNAAPGGIIDSGGFTSKLVWTITGFFKTITGTPIPFRADEWYWNPSRVISYEHGNPITEFPFFTFLYGDLHAHLIALPVALLVVIWVVSVIRGRAWARSDGRSWIQIVIGITIGGLAIGALYPINLSDIYTYLPLGSVALIYAIWRFTNGDVTLSPAKDIPGTVKRLVWVGLGFIALYLATKLIYQPYIHWYGQGYSEIRIWDGTHTPISEYMTHWGLFLFILISWMFHETIQWMASTPVSGLRKLEPYKGIIWIGIGAITLLIFTLGINLHQEGFSSGQFPVGLGIHIAWIVLPLSAWAGILLLRPGISEPKRIVLFFIGTGLLLTLMVETVVVSGDIGRMNTVFKFYLQSWTLFAVSSGAALGWLLNAMGKWTVQRRTIWQVTLSFLVLSATLYPLLGSVAKIMDRMEATAPHTLDGMTFMKYSTYHDEGVAMDLSQDYNAIRWMQDHVVGSPVIVEANSVEYHWGTRYTIYTGLPGVVGWNWHQRQQRTATPHDWVFERVDAVHDFYRTEDIEWTQVFLEKYDVRYIILGQLEKAKYAGSGLDKFASQEGILWEEVFKDRDTHIYEVIASP
jgi:YYY domain-containing protein